MAEFLAMPKLGLNMTQGTIVTWLVEEGEVIKVGQPVLEVETDKATQEVEAPFSGILAKIIRMEGDEVPCNQVIAVITATGEAIPDEIPFEIAEGVAPKSEIDSVKPTETTESDGMQSESESNSRIVISPSARKLAEELGVDITSITPQGSRISRSDVEAAYDAKNQIEVIDTESAIRVKPMSTMRKRIAEHMDRSARNVARVGLTIELDAKGLVTRREEMLVNGHKVSINVLLAEQVAKALVEFPYMNVQLRDDEIWEFEDINIGIAVDTDNGLMVPVIQNAGEKTIEELQNEFTSLVERALNGKSILEDLDGGTFTITNLGGLGILSFLPVINYPECAILSVGAIIEKPVAYDGQVVIRPIMQVTLAFDHRLVDGAPAARFLNYLKMSIENI